MPCIGIENADNTGAMQVSFAVERAHQQGIKNQLVEFPLPVGEAAYGIMGDSQGFAGGVSEQFRAARPTVERLLMDLKQKDGLKVSCRQGTTPQAKPL